VSRATQSPAVDAPTDVYYDMVFMIQDISLTIHLTLDPLNEVTAIEVNGES